MNDCHNIACFAAEREDRERVIFIPKTRKGMAQIAELVLDGIAKGII